MSKFGKMTSVSTVLSWLAVCLLLVRPMVPFAISSKPTVLILVNEVLYPDVQSSLTVFEEDLQIKGYDVGIVTVGDGLTPPEIKDIIKSWYDTADLEGVFLVGNISAAYAECHTGDFSDPDALKIWISLDATDMYYMDLDGRWENVTDPPLPGEVPSNVVECNLYPSCTTFRNEYIVYPDYEKRWDYSQITDKDQYKAEIWVSRIMAHNLEMAGSCEGEWKTVAASSGSPDLQVFSPDFNDQSISINGVVLPGSPGTSITSIHWNWGDGSSEDHWFPSSHTYAAYGEYTVTCTAFQSDWSFTTKSNSISLWHKTEAQVINEYLQKDHDYRAGSFHVANNAYILNAMEGYNDQGMDYSMIFKNIVKSENVTVDAYLSCLGDIQGSELLYLTAHSDPQLHALYDGAVTTADLETSNKTSLLYLLNACSSCRWDQCVSSPSDPNYLGGLYVFDCNPTKTNLGLCAMGFTGVGGFNNLHYFSDYLNNDHNSTYADAYKYWFNENLIINFSPNNYVVLGDPTIQPAMHNRSAQAVVRGLDDTIYHRIYDSSTEYWANWNYLPSGATCDSPAATMLGKELHIVVRGSDGYSLWYGYLTDPADPESFSGWSLLSGATNSAPTLTSNGTTLYLVVRGLDNRIYYRCYSEGAWGQWYAVPTGATCDSPAAAMLGNDLHIVVRGMDQSSLWDIIVRCDGTVVRDWSLLSGATPSRPVLAWSSSDSLCLVVRGMDNAIYYRSYTNSTDSWGSWSVLPTGATNDGPGATVVGNELCTVVRGMDGYTLWCADVDLGTSSFSGWSLIDGATPSAPTLTN